MPSANKFNALLAAAGVPHLVVPLHCGFVAREAPAPGPASGSQSAGAQPQSAPQPQPAGGAVVGLLEMEAYDCS